MNASLRVAKSLRERGHHIRYIGIPDCANITEPNGIELLPVFAETFPRNLLETLQNKFINLRGMARLREIRNVTKSYQKLIDALLNGENQEIQAALDATQPDLVIVNSSATYSVILALFAHARGVPIAYISPTLNHYPDSESPPFSSSLIPGQGRASKLKVQLSWNNALFRKLIRERVFIALGLEVNMYHLVSRLAEQCDFPADRINRRSMLAPVLGIPEFFTRAREFEFPSAQANQRHYLGATIDSERASPTFSWEQVSTDKPLLYCAFGSLLFLKQTEQRNLLQCVIDAARSRPDWQFVVATGNYVQPEELHSIPPNAVVMKHIPQIQLLSRADLMITHGGSNSVNECIHFGVPMIVFPLGFDQEGEAARVVYHGMGVRDNARRTSAAKINRMIDTVHGDPSFKAQTMAMSQKIRESDAYTKGIETIESLARPR
jgi:MGT family glycosyltransferase